MFRTLGISVAMTCVAPTLQAQSTPVTSWAAPAAEFPAEFSSIASVAELPDGKLLVVDSEDDRLYLVDFTSKEHKQIGRNGDGPKEYRRVSRVVPAGADTILVRASSRYLFYTAKDGLHDRVITDRPLMMMSPTGSDSRGRLYFQGPLMSFAQQKSYDSIPVYRVDRKTLGGDTVAWLRSGTSEEIEVKKAGARMGVSIVRNPYRWLDTYGVLDDGTVIIARAKDYSVEVVSPDGKKTTTPANAFPKLPVPKAEREKHPEFPEFKPPFVYDPSGTDRTSPKGQFWVRRSTAGSSDPLEYDIIRRDGKICRHVVMPPNTSLAGFSDRWVYTVREDADGLGRLQRREYPSCPL